MSIKKMFQGVIVPDASGVLPKAESAFLYEQSFNNNSGGAKTFALLPLTPADDYFIVLMSASFIVTGGNNPFIRAYPPGIIFKNFDGKDQAGIDLNNAVFPARLPIPARWSIQSVFLNEANGAFGTVSLYGVQLLDCFENCAGLLRTSTLG